MLEENTRGFADILSNLAIGTRIGLLVMVALLTVAITTGLFLLADRRMDEASNELSSYGDLVVLAASAERRAADLLILARDFITDRNAGAAATFAMRTIEVESLLESLPTIKAFQGHVGDSPNTFIEAMNAIDSLSRRAAKVRVYASMSSAVDATGC